MNKKLILLDRDGVINQESEHYIKSEEEWIPLPQSLEAIAALKQNGYRVAIATNQSGLTKGLYNKAALYAMHNKMQRLLAQLHTNVDAIFFCPHDDRQGCECRKPKPGLLQQAANYFQVDFKTHPVFFIGDALRDLEAAHAAGCKPLLVLTGYGQKTLKSLSTHAFLKSATIPVYENLYQAAEALLNNTLPYADS
jgi:D-glycero-D-manno-heptose 1,7-bisphosphate phosphatase